MFIRSDFAGSGSKPQPIGLGRPTLEPLGLGGAPERLILGPVLGQLGVALGPGCAVRLDGRGLLGLAQGHLEALAVDVRERGCRGSLARLGAGAEGIRPCPGLSEPLSGVLGQLLGGGRGRLISATSPAWSRVVGAKRPISRVHREDFTDPGPGPCAEISPAPKGEG